MSTTLVTIYAPSGAKENHTTLNAVDLVRNCGYTFKPGKAHAVTDGLPYADAATGKLPSRAQQALDSVGTGSEVGSEGQNHLDALASAAGAAQTSEPPLTARAAPAAEPVIEPAAPAAEPVIEPAAPAAEEAPAAEPVIEPAAEPAAEEAPAAPKLRQQRAKKA